MTTSTTPAIQDILTHLAIDPTKVTISQIPTLVLNTLQYVQTLTTLSDLEKKNLVYDALQYIINTSTIPQSQITMIDDLITNYIAIDQGLVNIVNDTNGCSCCKTQ